MTATFRQAIAKLSTQGWALSVPMCPEYPRVELETDRDLLVVVTDGPDDFLGRPLQDSIVWYLGLWGNVMLTSVPR